MKTLKIPHFIKALILFTIANLVIIGIRNSLVGDSFFIFIKSNLISDIIPFVIAIILQYFNPKSNNIFFIIGTIWNTLFSISDHMPAYYMMGLFGFVQYLLLVMTMDFIPNRVKTETDTNAICNENIRLSCHGLAYDIVKTYD